jgi:hypothetical protein
MFIKELKINIDFLKSEIEKALSKPTEKDVNYFCEFKMNLFKGIEYYREILPKMIEETAQARRRILKELYGLKAELEHLMRTYPLAFPQTAPSESALATV